MGPSLNRDGRKLRDQGKLEAAGGFNGAVAESRRKGPNKQYGTGSASCFNGAVAESRRKGNHDTPRSQCRVRASMGPSLNRDGRVGADVLDSASNAASMGPSLNRDGRTRPPHRTRGGAGAASMGPSLNRDGRSRRSFPHPHECSSFNGAVAESRRKV